MPERPKNAAAMAHAYPRPNVVSTRNVDERVCPPPPDAMPADPGIHTRWVRKHPRRVSDMKRKYGYEVATEADVVPGHGGYEGENGTIENGDLVLMKADRQVIEEKELKRREATAGMDVVQRRADEALGIEETDQHRGRRGRRGRSFNVPIDLSH